MNIVPVPLEDVLDIRPGACPNPLSTRSRGLLRLALLGTLDIDVREIDPESIRLGDAGPIRTWIGDIGSPGGEEGECVCSSNVRDGVDDMIMTFRVRDVVGTYRVDWPARRSARREVVLFLWGSVGDPVAEDFIASDCAVIPGPPLHRDHQDGGKGADIGTE